MDAPDQNTLAHHHWTLPPRNGNPSVRVDLLLQKSRLGGERYFNVEISGLLHPYCDKAKKSFNYMGTEVKNPALLEGAAFLKKAIERGMRDTIQKHRLLPALGCNPSHHEFQMQEGNDHFFGTYTLNPDSPARRGAGFVAADDEKIIAMFGDIKSQLDALVPESQRIFDLPGNTKLEPNPNPSDKEIDDFAKHVGTAWATAMRQAERASGGMVRGRVTPSTLDN